MPHYSIDERKVLRNAIEEKKVKHDEYWGEVAEEHPDHDQEVISEIRKPPADWDIILKLLDDLDESEGLLTRVLRTPPTSPSHEVSNA